MTKPVALRQPAALTAPQPGDFCCVPISGRVGWAIELGQFLAGDTFQPYDHAEVFVGQADTAGPHGYTVSAYPDRRGRRPLPCDPAVLPGSLWSSGILPLTDAQRQGILAWCMSHTEVTYSFLDYLALELHTLHIPAPGLRGRIETSAHLICSQYVDTAWGRGGGVQLFDDGRWPGYVKPGDLAMLLQAKMPPAQLSRLVA